MSENPYASPERVEDLHENPMLGMMLGGYVRDKKAEMMAVRRGLWRTWWRGLFWLMAAGMALVTSVALQIKMETDDLVYAFHFVFLGATFLLAVIGSVPALLSLRFYLRGMTDMNPQGRDELGMSWVCMTIGVVLMLPQFTVLSLAGLVLVCIGFWKWFRFLEFVAWKVKSWRLMRCAFVSGMLSLGWFGTRLAIVLFAVIAIAFQMPIEVFEVLVLVLLFLSHFCGCAYFVVELVLVGGLIRRLGEMLNMENSLGEMDW